jgi:hypothetical protein
MKTDVIRKKKRKKNGRKEMPDYLFISCKTGVHIMLSRRPSSLLRLLGLSSTWIASIMRRSMYPDVLERTFVF